MVLQTAQATQITNAEGKGDWTVMDNKGNELYKLSKELSEKEVMEAIHFARVFEKLAYKEGAEHLEKFYINRLDGLTANYEAIIDNLKNESMRLAMIIENSDIFKEEE